MNIYSSPNTICQGHLVNCAHCGYPAYSINYLTCEPEARCPKCNKTVYKKADMTPAIIDHKCRACGFCLSDGAIAKQRCQACGVAFKDSHTEIHDPSKEVRCNVKTDFIGPPKPEPKQKGIAVQCGCGRHFVAIDGDKTVHYKGKWWKLSCLFIRVDRRMRKIIDEYQKMENEVKAYHKMRLKFIRMKNFMRQLPCSHCGAQVGNRFAQVGDGILCGNCRHDNREL